MGLNEHGKNFDEDFSDFRIPIHINGLRKSRIPAYLTIVVARRWQNHFSNGTPCYQKLLIKFNP